MSGKAHFEVFQGRDNVVDGVGSGAFKAREGEWYWRLRAANGEIVATGEGYTRPEDAERGCTTVAETAAAIEWVGPEGSAVMVERVDE